MGEGGLFALIVGRMGGERLDVRPQIVDMQVAGAALLASLLLRFVPLRISDTRSLYRSFPSFDAGNIYPIMRRTTLILCCRSLLVALLPRRWVSVLDWRVQALFQWIDSLLAS